MTRIVSFSIPLLLCLSLLFPGPAMSVQNDPRPFGFRPMEYITQGNVWQATGMAEVAGVQSSVALLPTATTGIYDLAVFSRSGSGFVPMAIEGGQRFSSLSRHIHRSGGEYFFTVLRNGQPYLYRRDGTGHWMGQQIGADLYQSFTLSPDGSMATGLTSGGTLRHFLYQGNTYVHDAGHDVNGVGATRFPRTATDGSGGFCTLYQLAAATTVLYTACLMNGVWQTGMQVAGDVALPSWVHMGIAFAAGYYFLAYFTTLPAYPGQVFAHLIRIALALAAGPTLGIGSQNSYYFLTGLNPALTVIPMLALLPGPDNYMYFGFPGHVYRFDPVLFSIFYLLNGFLLASVYIFMLAFLGTTLAVVGDGSLLLSSYEATAAGAVPLLPSPALWLLAGLLLLGGFLALRARGAKGGEGGRGLTGRAPSLRPGRRRYQRIR